MMKLKYSALPAPVTTMLAEWQILHCSPGSAEAESVAAGKDEWIPASAPGDTYLALHAAGVLPHPFERENEQACAWVKDREWWWRSQFAATPARHGERVVLTFDGLDTYASVWLNGQLLGATDNMFTASRFDIGNLLRSDAPNLLLVRFTPPGVVSADKNMETWDIIADPIKESKRQFHRKAQFGWGWDWAPRLPGVGIWRAVRIERQKTAVIDDVRFTTESIGATAKVSVAVGIDCFATTDRHPESLSADVTLAAPDGTVAATGTVTFDTPGHPSAIRLDVAAPQLWWTSELGEPALYTLTVRLIDAGQTLDRRTLQVGIRTIELDTSPDPDEAGCDFFRFVLNGVAVFARGVNWIPASSCVGAVSEADYERLLSSSAAANINMMRVWGGGVYESDRFYETCDRLGLLVWQDFMFACAPYPEHEPILVESVRQEVAQQIVRLRHHPCLALWCGNNEGQAVHQFMTMMAATNTPYPGDLFFQKIIPEALTRLDPSTPYWPGSPYGGPSHNSMRAGDVHNWTVWHGVPPIPDALPEGTFDHSPEAVAYTRYAEDRARFVSEFGIQASPSHNTLSRWLASEDLALGTRGFLNRIKDHPQDKVNAMLLPVTGLPTTLDQYIEFTQLVQAEGLKYGIEHYRRRKPHCSGTLIWQYNDCWPGVSWSLIDYDGARKASWYYVARAYAPVIGSFRTAADGTIELWVTNDMRIDIASKATLTLTSLSGNTPSIGQSPPTPARSSGEAR
jgi:beta-mannosidase